MNWGLSTVVSRIEEGVTDVYGRDHAREVMVRLHAYVARQHGSRRGRDAAGLLSPGG
jgi:hypothetical protein